jgi:hypothetical protein
MNEKKKLFLADIAKEKNLASAQEVLAVLIPNIPVYAHVENVSLTNSMISKVFPITDLPIPEMYLNIILSRGAWEGRRIQIRSFDFVPRVTEAMFSKDIRLSLEDLFVFEPDLVDLESRNPDIFAEKPTKLTIPAEAEEPLSPKLEKSFYALVGILLDLLVDKKGENFFALPTDGSKYTFASQADLVGHIEIETKAVYGFKKSSLEEKFGKANSILKAKLDA